MARAVPPPGDDTAAGPWGYILVAVSLLLAGVILRGVYLTFKLMRAPVPREIPEPAAPGPVTVRTPPRPVLREPGPPGPLGAPGEPAADAAAIALPPRELAEHLEAQARLLREEARRNEDEGTGSGLTPPADEIGKLTAEGRVIY